MPKAAKDLINKIISRKASIGIIGLGYVGLPLVIRFGEENFKIIGFDIDKSKVDKLNRGESYIKHIQSERIKQLIDKNRFQAISDYSRLKEVDCILICVPTPLNSKREPDLSYIENSSDEIAKYLRKGQLISMESTTYPGTTREILLHKFEKGGLKVGKDSFLVFSPERENPGDSKYNTRNIPKVIGGISQECVLVGKTLYEQIVDEIIVVSSPEAAEFTKLLENIFRAVNIALVNELKMLADKMGVDIWEVIEAASTKPFGFMPFYPGPGLGGHCVPIDPFYLSWKARELNFNTHFIELAGELNTNMPNYVISKITEALNKSGKCLKNSKVLILGVAYKKDVDDMRESPSLEIIKTLQDREAKIYYNDPYIPKIPKLRKHEFNLKSSPLSKKLLNEMDAVLIITDHSTYDYEWIVENSKLVIDTRNATHKLINNRFKIVKS